MSVLHILSGTRLEILLFLVAGIFLWYSADARDLLRLVPMLRPAVDERGLKHVAELEAIHNNAYNLILVIADRVTRNLIHWSLVSIAFIVSYNVGDYFQIRMMASEHITHVVLAAVYGSPLCGIILSVFWVRRLTLELRSLVKTPLILSQFPPKDS